MYDFPYFLKLRSKILFIELLSNLPNTMYKNNIFFINKLTDFNGNRATNCLFYFNFILLFNVSLLNQKGLNKDVKTAEKISVTLNKGNKSFFWIFL